MRRRFNAALPFSSVLDSTVAQVCRTCQGSLQFHQPDMERPDRLLGICTYCHSWNLFGIGDDCRVHVMPPTDEG